MCVNDLTSVVVRSRALAGIELSISCDSQSDVLSLYRYVARRRRHAVKVNDSAQQRGTRECERLAQRRRTTQPRLAGDRTRDLVIAEVRRPAAAPPRRRRHASKRAAGSNNRERRGAGRAAGRREPNDRYQRRRPGEAPVQRLRPGWRGAEV